jgi:hemerythrin-like domain-containing protein
MSAMFTNRISQKLHEEHRATMAIMERLETLLTSQRRAPPDSNAHASFLRDVAVSVESEVNRHFDFEEHHLFTFLDSAGDVAIGAHLTAEHTAMRPLGARLATLSRAAAAGGCDEASWNELRQVGMDYCERMLTHVQKEEMALLPLIEESMDVETEEQLYDVYVANA